MKRYLRLLCVAVGSASLIIVVVVLLTPPADLIEDAAIQPVDSIVHELAGSEGTHSELVLPLQAEEIDVKAVEKELSGLAEHLQGSYPGDAHALLVAGRAYSDMQQSTRARQLFRRCVDLAPQEPSAYVGLAENLMLDSRDEEAADVLRNAIAQGRRSAQVIRTLAEALAGLGQIEEAIRVLREGVQDFPTESQNWLRLGQMQIQVRRFQEAEASLRQSMNLGEDGGRVLIALNTALTRQGKHEEASEVRKHLAGMRLREERLAEFADAPFHDEYAQSFRHNAKLWFVAGAKVYLDHGERERAETLLKRAISLDPQRSKSYVLLASLYLHDGRLADVIVVLQRLIRLEPENVQHYLALAAIAGRIGNEALAERVLQQAVRRDTGGRTHFLLAQLHLSQGRYAEARKAAETAAERMQNVDAFLLLKSTCEVVRDHTAANKALRKARLLAPNDPRLNRLQARR